ncbi:DUF6773 family protein [Guptibacillus hwajinpoensis]|uniref:Uncharacterized protein n=1 Tax=Guptibacillus hwajinpoensis TaxID=208199 RepID=A0A0J6FUG0_9BACL|nr:DUF6773 family protein [Alkalihalobacillus macyae]KMM37992.1 hypothetical protein AB986_01290 [Alkalihalobacillus macyae]
MKLFSKRKVLDERLSGLQNGIFRELYSIVVGLCGLSIFYEQFFGEVGLANIWLELVIIIGGGAYYMIRSSMLGIFTDEVEMHDRSSKWKMSTKNIVISVLVGLGISLTFATINSQRFGETRGETIEFFFTIFFTCIMIYIPFLFAILVLPYAFAKYRSDKVNKQELEDIDDEDEQDVR